MNTLPECYTTSRLPEADSLDFCHFRSDHYLAYPIVKSSHANVGRLSCYCHRRLTTRRVRRVRQTPHVVGRRTKRFVGVQSQISNATNSFSKNEVGVVGGDGEF
jgi:hypothetical protein